MLKTMEGGNAFEHSLDHALELFSKGGSLFEKRSSFYGNEESALSLFQKSWIVDKEISMKLLLWLRDCRGGAGNRSGFRSCLAWLAGYDPKWIEVNLDWIPLVGRWDDLRVLFNTPLEKVVAKYWASYIKEENVLAAKWADRSDKPLRRYLQLAEKDFRKLLASIRQNHIVEFKMCGNLWAEVQYKTVPSVAMARYTNAFTKHDEKQFLTYKEALKNKETTINAGVLFPHDCVRTVKNGDKEIGEAQFDALPNYIKETNEKIIVISDTSGSMSTPVSGSICAVDISQGLALYCSSKLPKDNPFYKKFIGFCSEGKFKDWNGMSFSQAICDRKIFDGAVGSTRIDKALDLILYTAKFFNLSKDQMPTMLLIVSDMQFHRGTEGSNSEVNKALIFWKENGYDIPKIIYWNTAGNVGSVETKLAKNVALVSGFSPSILKAIFASEDLTPIGVMTKALEKYTITVP